MIKETKAQKKGAQTKGGKKVKGSAITLLEAIEQVVHLSEDTFLSEAFLKKAYPWTSHLAQRYGISERQAVLFCISMEKGPRRVDYNDLARHLGVSHIRALSYASDIDALVHRRLLRYRDAKEEDTFDVHQPVIRALKHNEVYELPQRSGLDCAALFEVLNMLFDDLSDDTITAFDLQGELEALFDENPQINFVKQINELPLSTEDLLLLLLFCHLLINKDDDDIRFSQMEDIFEEKGIKGRDEPDLAGVCVFTEQIQHQTDGEPVKEQQFREWEEPDQRHHPEGAEMDQFPENFLRIRDRGCRRVFSHYLLKTQILRLQGGLQIQPAPGLLPPCRRGRQRWR